MVSKILNIYVMLLAILGILIASGWINVTSEIEFQILKPTYVIYIKGFDPNDTMYRSETEHRIRKVLLDSVDIDFIIVDMPIIDSTNFRKQRLVTDGHDVFSCWFALWSDEVLANQLFPEKFQPPLIEMLPLVNSEDKRIALKCALDHDFKLSLNPSKKKSITNDSLLKLIEDLPTDCLVPLFKHRTVYNFISIENLSDYKAQDVLLRVVEPGRLIIGGPPTIDLIGWTLPGGGGAISRMLGHQLEFKLPVLKGRDSVQLLIKSKSAKIEKSDVFLDYSKVKSLNKKQVVLWLIIMALASILIYFIENRFSTQ